MSPGPVIEVRRVYEERPSTDTGRWVLVDRLWPRGVAKAGATWDEWAKDVAPSTELRRGYGHVADRFESFAEDYRAELGRPPASDALERLVALTTTESLILLTATRDVDHSGARVLQQVIDDVLRSRG